MLFHRPLVITTACVYWWWFFSFSQNTTGDGSRKTTIKRFFSRRKKDKKDKDDTGSNASTKGSVSANRLIDWLIIVCLFDWLIDWLVMNHHLFCKDGLLIRKAVQQSIFHNVFILPDGSTHSDHGHPTPPELQLHQSIHGRSWQRLPPTQLA